MSGDIFLNIDTIVLRGLHHIDRHALETALRRVLQEQLSSNREFHATDLNRMRTKVTLPVTFTAEQLGQTLGQSLIDTFSQHEETENSDGATQRVGENDA
ncbi:MAG: hypothetical protein GY732_15615 [Gammaproteobacteria bacterium]|nr:hypothetical protein [Gammaproteobacteria bacterium]